MNYDIRQKLNLIVKTPMLQRPLKVLGRVLGFGVSRFWAAGGSQLSGSEHLGFKLYDLRCPGFLSEGVDSELGGCFRSQGNAAPYTLSSSIVFGS